MFHGVPECSRVERYSGALTRSSLPVCYCVPVCFSVPACCGVPACYGVPERSIVPTFYF